MPCPDAATRKSRRRLANWVILATFLFLPVLQASSSSKGLTLRRQVSTKRRASFWAMSPTAQKVIAGGVGRAVAQALLYPVDALRTLAQTRDGRTLSDVGIEALSKGCLQTSSVALLQGSIQFGIFGVAKERFGPLVASALGAAGSCIVSVPQEVLKQRLVTGIYSNFREAVSTIYRTEGLLGFYSAWKPTVSRNVPFVITTFTTMHFIERRLLAQRKKHERKELTEAENLMIGIGSAMMAIVVSQPFDVVKTRMMTQASSTAVPYSSAFDCFLSIVNTEGFSKLYTGFKERGVYQCGLWGITFAMNGVLRKKLKEEGEKR